MNARRILGFVLLLASGLLVVPARAGGSGPADPFAESHARLMRAADAQLEKMRDVRAPEPATPRSEEHTSELQSR